MGVPQELQAQENAKVPGLSSSEGGRGVDQTVKGEKKKLLLLFWLWLLPLLLLLFLWLLLLLLFLLLLLPSPLPPPSSSLPLVVVSALREKQSMRSALSVVVNTSSGSDLGLKHSVSRTRRPSSFPVEILPALPLFSGHCFPVRWALGTTIRVAALFPGATPPLRAAGTRLAACLSLRARLLIPRCFARLGPLDLT